MRNRFPFLVWGFTLLLSTAVLAEPAPPAEPQGPILQSIVWRGNVALSSATLNDRIPLKVGKPYNAPDLRFSVNMVESLYRDKGYYRVAVTSQVVSPAQNQVAVFFDIREGEIYYVGKIELEGHHDISGRIINRNLGIKTNDVFSQSKVFDGNRQLYMTGYFSSIDISYATATFNTVDIRIRMRERATRFIKGATGYGSQTKESVKLGYEDTNFIGGARKFDISATHSGFLTHPDHYRTTLIQTNLVQPYLFGTPYEGSLNVSREYDDREAYDSNSTATRFGLGRRFSQEITASMRYRYQGTRVTRVNVEAQTPGFTNVSAFGPTFAYDNTDDPFLPSIGWRVLGTYEEAVKYFAGDVRFHKAESRAGRFDRVFGKWVLFEGLQAGMILPDSTSDTDIIPIYERYFLGGANSVRGYSERSLGPRSTTGTPLGGNTFLVGNLEIRHPLYKKLWGVAFLDGGQLYPTESGHRWPHLKAHRLDDFRYGTGLGVRLNSPIGAIRLEFGYKLNEYAQKKFLDRTAVHFSIGEVF